MDSMSDALLSLAAAKLREGLDDVIRSIGRNERADFLAVSHLAFALGIMEAYVNKGKKHKEKEEESI